MLPAAARLTRGAQISATVRRGARGSRHGLTVHLLEAPPGAVTGPRATVVTPRAVGTAVVRNRVRRRIRHLLRDHLTALPPGSRLVVRADARAAGLAAQELAASLAGALAAARARGRRPPEGSGPAPAPAGPRPAPGP